MDWLKKVQVGEEMASMPEIPAYLRRPRPGPD